MFSCFSFYTLLLKKYWVFNPTHLSIRHPGAQELCSNCTLYCKTLYDAWWRLLRHSIALCHSIHWQTGGAKRCLICSFKDVSVTIYGCVSGNEACAWAHNSLSEIYKLCICSFAKSDDNTVYAYFRVCAGRVFVLNWVVYIWPQE